ncbi:glycosyl transferase family protein [Acetomicrobium sp.]|uniref:glycosyl transferase family protein n=1 Tax=Acetomicrobium sp. TaxID=1872099 RepID=UPI002FC97B47
MIINIYYQLVHVTFLICLYLIFFWGIEDFIIDVYYWIRVVYRKLFVYTKYPRLTVEDLYRKDEQWIAIMVPAWHEAGVIARMLETTIKHLDYDRYVIFCGVYPNDPETSREVDGISQNFQGVVKVVVPHPGPTNKADCLNFIVKEVHSYELLHDINFSGFVLHDSEDIVHPLELKLFNYLLPRKDMMQIPVTSLERSWKDFVACTYLDEFSEWHLKNLLVRERMTKIIPSAGVGTCFSRRAISFLEQKNEGNAFPTGSLTEDYVAGLTLAEGGMQGIILHFPIAFPRGRGLRRIRRVYVSVSEYFPDTFWAAVRQKSRWILGIALQGTETFGWRGDIFDKFFLYRDRKGMFTSFINFVANILFINYILIFIGIKLNFMPSYNYNIPKTLLIINIFFLINRLFHRALFVFMLYGWQQSLLSIPRVFVVNFINFCATLRALKLFGEHLLSGKPLVWDKTQHVYPAEEQLAAYRRRLGDILLQWKVLREEDLQAALREQRESNKLLGEILIKHRLIDEDILFKALSEQSGLPLISVNEINISESADILPVKLCVEYRIFPVSIGTNEKLRLAVTKMISPECLEEIKKYWAGPLEFCLMKESDMLNILTHISNLQVNV